jgi:hypothetical protein
MANYGRGFNFQIVTVNAREVADSYFDVGEAIADLRPAFREAFRLLEADEVEHFAKMRGRYILTGATMRSLTRRRAAGAIREAHGTNAAFGTRVLHAHYLTKSPYDVENDQVSKHNGHGRSAVLVSKPATRRAIADLVLEHVARPFGDR